MRDVVKWCQNCDVPILGENCELCGSKGRDCAKDLKPMFDKELELFEKLLRVKIPRSSFRYRNRIIVGGKTYLTFRIDPQNEKLILVRGPIDKEKVFATDNDIIERAIKANLGLLKEKEAITVEFIKKVCEDSSLNVVLFGGGKDSTLTAILAKAALGKIPLLFIDTTLEFPETYIFIEKFTRTYRFDLLKDENDNFYSAKNDFFQLCERLGPPSIYCRWCCHIFKEQPVRYFLNCIKDKDIKVVFLTGIRRLESRRRGNFFQVERGKRIIGQTLFQPIIDWKDIEVWLYTFWKKIEINKLYELGHARVGCWPCPCAPPLMDFIRRITHPYLWRKFEKILLKYAKENSRSDEWVKKGLWRIRRPKRQKSIIQPTKIEDCGGELVFKYRLPRGDSLINRLKVVGNLQVSNRQFEVKSNSINIYGKIEDEYIELQMRYDKKSYVNTKMFIEKLLSRSLNCIGCGACISSCPQGALQVTEKGVAVSDKCDRCWNCLKIPCVIEDSERMISVKMDPFIISPCEKGLAMNHILLPNGELGEILARRLRAKGIDIEVHEGGKILCVSTTFSIWRLEKYLMSSCHLKG